MPPLPETPTLHTDRLTLRPLALDDVPAIQREFPHWEIIRYMTGQIPWPYPDDGALTHTRMCLAQRERGEKFFWVITPRGREAELIGRIDLWPDDGVTREMRGFWLARAHQGQGLMAEAAECVTRYAFETLGWPYLWLDNAVENTASGRVKEKQGAVLIDTISKAYVYGEGLGQVWRLDREAWLNRRG